MWYNRSAGLLLPRGRTTARAAPWLGGVAAATSGGCPVHANLPGMTKAGTAKSVLAGIVLVGLAPTIPTLPSLAVLSAPSKCLPVDPYDDSCTFFLRPDESLLHGDEMVDANQRLVAYSFVVADREGQVREQCQLFVPLPGTVDTTGCDAGGGWRQVRAGAVPAQAQ